MVTIINKPKKDRHHNGQKKKDKQRFTKQTIVQHETLNAGCEG